jgi:CRP/FNR family transcriptional regulator, dissimilatory nitrate respiration regulator
MQKSKEIERAPLFNGLPERQLDELAGIALEQRIERGQTLFHEGGEAAGFYLVTRGKIKIYKLSLEGKEQILHIFGRGEVFGEVPVFAGGRYPAHAEALEPGEVLFFSRGDFTALVRREPSLALNMLAMLSQRLRRFTHMIEDLSLKEVPGRLAAYFLVCSERSGGAKSFELDITKAQLASLLGTIPETLSRIFAKMSQQGIVTVDGPRITVLDRAAIEDMAAGEKPQI